MCRDLWDDLWHGEEPNWIPSKVFSCQNLITKQGLYQNFPLRSSNIQHIQPEINSTKIPSCPNRYRIPKHSLKPQKPTTNQKHEQKNLTNDATQSKTLPPYTKPPTQRRPSIWQTNQHTLLGRHPRQKSTNNLNNLTIAPSPQSHLKQTRYLPTRSNDRLFYFNRPISR